MKAAPRRTRPSADPTVYPSDDEMGEGLLQRLISELLRSLIERWLREAGTVALTGANQYIYWVQYDPHKCVAPDVYVLPGIAPDTNIPSWKTWEHEGLVPSFALEIVSSDRLKDYEEAPKRYADLGSRELVVFDPEWQASNARLRFQVYRRLKKRGLVRVEATNDDRVRSKVLGCWVRAVGEGDATRLRLATGKSGDVLYPTEVEAVRTQKETLAARVRELEAELAKQRR